MQVFIQPLKTQIWDHDERVDFWFNLDVDFLELQITELVLEVEENR